MVRLAAPFTLGSISEEQAASMLPRTALVVYIGWNTGIVLATLVDICKWLSLLGLSLLEVAVMVSSRLPCLYFSGDFLGFLVVLYIYYSIVIFSGCITCYEVAC